ncbi:TetR-like C-terminal domain-containing protein [Streptomyces sp. NPDC002671]
MPTSRSTTGSSAGGDDPGTLHADDAWRLSAGACHRDEHVPHLGPARAAVRDVGDEDRHLPGAGPWAGQAASSSVTRRTASGTSTWSSGMAPKCAGGRHNGGRAEAVAARADVAKSTIYCWRKSKAPLVMDAYRTAVEQRMREPDTGSLAGDLTAFVTALYGVTAYPIRVKTLRGLMAEAQLDPAFAGPFLVPPPGRPPTPRPRPGPWPDRSTAARTSCATRAVGTTGPCSAWQYRDTHDGEAGTLFAT